MNDGFFDVKLLFATPQSFHDSSPQGALTAEPSEGWQEGRRGTVPYEVNAIFGRPMIAPTNNVCPVFWNSMHCPIRSECCYNLPYKQLSLLPYFNSLILNSPFSYIIYVCGLPPLGIETEPGFKYVKSPISSFARICV